MLLTPYSPNLNQNILPFHFDHSINTNTELLKLFQ